MHSSNAKLMSHVYILLALFVIYSTFIQKIRFYYFFLFYAFTFNYTYEISCFCFKLPCCNLYDDSFKILCSNLLLSFVVFSYLILLLFYLLSFYIFIDFLYP